MENYKRIEPLKIPDIDLPLIVLSDDLRGFFAWGIKIHEEGQYSHAMIMAHSGVVASQGGTYKEFPIKNYMKDKYRLKFWAIKNLAKQEREIIIQAVSTDLKQNWFKKSYDWIGIIGQLFNLRGINNPYKYYCSERIARYLRLINDLKDIVPLHPSPADLNRIFKIYPEKFGLYGYWWND